jgi:hypothetical protein
MLQSLWQNPYDTPQNPGLVVNNTVWGYYADGWFDRRKIGDGVRGAAGYAGTNSSVSTGDSGIAQIGTVFYNPTAGSYASLFFPAGGFRDQSLGNIMDSGSRGNYSMSTAYRGDMAWAMGFGKSGSSAQIQFVGQNSWRSFKFNVRCVKDDSLLPPVKPNPDTIVDDILPPEVSFHPYGGAFWRAAETGERLIYIERPTDDIIDGDWTAMVLVGDDFITLDTQMTTDVNVGWRKDVTPNEANVDDPYTDGQAFDTAHAVNGKWWVRGAMNENIPQIYFRIGLKSELAGGATAVPRYGLVLLTYKNNTMNQRIWIRQGEGDDYLFSPSEVISSGVLSGQTRGAAVKFSPFNLTAQTLDAAVNYQGEPANGQDAYFVNYPSKAGALFQWLGKSSGLYVYNAHLNTATTVTWGRVGGTAIWSDNNSWVESCPKGYHRPSNGPIDELAEASATGVPVMMSAQLAQSEMQASLMETPQLGIYNEQELIDQGNYSLGRYADGYFDRRKAGDDPTGGRPNSTVSADSRELAYTGGVFYNPKTYHSIFFPKVNKRGEYDLSGNNIDKELHAAGIGDQYYWSSSNNSQGGWALAGYPNTGIALAIRCVAD